MRWWQGAVIGVAALIVVVAAIATHEPQPAQPPCEECSKTAASEKATWNRTPDGTRIEDREALAREHDANLAKLNKVCPATSQQKATARNLIRLNGFDCEHVDGMCPFRFFGEGYTVYCNDMRYTFELANHGGRWTVTPP